MNTFLRNTISILYNTVLAPVTATRDALAERLQGMRDTASLLYNKMMENMGYGQERVKDIVEKEQKEKNQQQQKKKKKPRSNSKNQQQPKKSNRMMMMSNMMQLQK